MTTETHTITESIIRGTTLKKALACLTEVCDTHDDNRAHGPAPLFPETYNTRLHLDDVYRLMRAVMCAMETATLQQTTDPIYREVYDLLGRLEEPINALDEAVELGTLGEPDTDGEDPAAEASAWIDSTEVACQRSDRGGS